MKLVEVDTTVESDSNSTVCFSSDDSYSSGDTFVYKTSDSGGDDDYNDNDNVFYVHFLCILINLNFEIPKFNQSELSN